MNIKRYFAPTAREALRLVKEELGGDAIVLSNRSVDDGVEITAVLASEIPAEPFADAPRIVRDEDFTVSLSPKGTSFGAHPKGTSFGAHPKGTSFGASGGERKPAAPARPPVTEKQTVREWQPSAARSESVRARPEKRKSQSAEDAATAVPDDSQLMRELVGIKDLIEQQLAGFAWTGLGHEAPAKTLLLADLLDAGFSAYLARRLVGSLPAGATREEGHNWLKGVLSRNLHTAGTDDEIIDAGGVFALVGPTGVGKTTTTAKLAARCVVRHGADSVALLTTDGYRIGAHEQLRIYGRILGVQVHAVRDSTDLRRTLADLADKHMVLIDTIGMSQRDRMVAEQASMLDGAGDVRRLLLLNATSRGDTLDDVVRAYGRETGGGDLAGVILTKVDEALSLAPAIDALIRSRLELYYVANGQRVPEDLHLPNRAYLLHRSLKGLPENSPHRLVGDEAGLLLSAGSTRAGQPLGALHG